VYQNAHRVGVVFVRYPSVERGSAGRVGILTVAVTGVR
jgi:hypothetical protein